MEQAGRRAGAGSGPASSPSPARSARPAPRRRCASCCRGRADTHAPVASYNNHWGVPLTLVPHAGPMSPTGVYEIGMNSPARSCRWRSWCGRRSSIITTIQPGASGRLHASVEGIAEEKAGDLLGAEAGRNGHRQCRHPAIRACCCDTGRNPSPAGQIITFGEHARCRCHGWSPGAEAGHVGGRGDRVFGEPVAYRLGSPGKHIVLNSLGGAARWSKRWAPISRSAALALGDLEAAGGARGAADPARAGRQPIVADRREL